MRWKRGCSRWKTWFAKTAIPLGRWCQRWRALAAFQRQDFSAAIEAIETVWDQRDRLVGSLAQTDLIEGTLLRAYVEAGRLDDVIVCSASDVMERSAYRSPASRRSIDQSRSAQAASSRSSSFSRPSAFRYVAVALDDAQDRVPCIPVTAFRHFERLGIASFAVAAVERHDMSARSFQ